MDKKPLLARGIAISLGLYGLLSLSMPSIYSYSEICLGMSGHLFYLLTGLGFLLAGALINGWPRSGSLLAASLFVPQSLAFDTADFSYNFIGPVHVVFRHHVGETLILHINLLALVCCALLLLYAISAGRWPRAPQGMP
ncbi:TPA: hypothetical protein L5634_001396 [Pseudomonas aeruginosa]|nr:hypothetical protein [Pseudomonas aeruginosa]